jgi:hypothetical protein
VTSPAWAWLYLAVIINAAWIGYDIWAKLHHHWTLSRQMHDWFFSPTIGPFVFAAIAAIFVLAVMHFLRYHAHQ